jgi:signal transduction histidine kinase
MKAYSLTRRLISTVLLLELVLALCTTGAALFYERHQHLRTFDVLLRGRADSLLGAVQDAEDPADNVMLDPQALDLQPGDIWEVRDASGHVLGHAVSWTPGLEAAFKPDGRGHNMDVAGHRFRGLIVRGVRQIDQENGSPGLARPVVIFYAASLKPVAGALKTAAKFLLLSNSLGLLLTGGVLFLLLRRGLLPLSELSAAAAAVVPERWQFRAPPSAQEVKELRVLANALDSAMARIEQSFRQQQGFLHDAAHELKTAVTIIKSSMQLLTSRPRTARDYAAGLETCLADCGRMEELVHRMLLLARFEQRDPRASSQTEAVDLADRMRGAISQMENFAELKKVRLVPEISGSAALVPLSSEACDTLLTNLLMNAVQHSPADGVVRMSLAVCQREARFQVDDSGSGIDPAELPHIFERFYRGDPSRSRRTGGTGLGLAICKAITESCAGSITVRSEVGVGTSVAVTLPLITAAIGPSAAIIDDTKPVPERTHSAVEDC